MTWWSWMVLGALLLAAELFAIDAQFYLVFLGVSAVLVGLTSLFGIVMPEWAQWTMFAVLSLISFVTFRKALYEKIHGGVVGFKESLAGNTIDVVNDLAAGDEAGVVESVKAASDIYAPVGGEVIAVNAQLEDEPEIVNGDPYNDGWFFRLQPGDSSELEKLLNAEDYAAQCAEE